MDLLTGYGSSSDDSDDYARDGDGDGDGDGVNRGGREDGAAVEDVSASTGEGGGASRTSAAAAAAAAAAASSSPSAAGVLFSNSSSARGRKVLSLTSFLPPQVLARLTKAQALHPYDSDYDYDYDDDDSNSSEGYNEEADLKDGHDRDTTLGPAKSQSRGSVSASPSERSAPRGGISQGEMKVDGGGLSSLLRDLRAARPANTSALDRTAAASTAPQTLGQAFVTVQSMSKSARRRAEGNGEVVDVHRASATTAKTPHVTERAPSPSKEHPRTFQRPRPVAAPNKVQVQQHPQEQALQAPVNDGEQHYTYAPNPNYYGRLAEAAQGASPAVVNRHGSHLKKRSRKELERALRHGNLDALQDPSRAYGVDVQSLRQADPSEYANSLDPIALEASMAAQIPHHGIRVGPTLMYDASAGTTATVMVGATGSGGSDTATTMRTLKGRGKNQIHHVVAAAAQLEMQRARQQGPNHPTGAANASTHRANAKAKYGW